MKNYKVSINIEQKNNIPTITIIDGVIYSQQQLAKYIGIDKGTIYKKFMELRKDENALITWIKKKKWLKIKGLKASTVVYVYEDFFVLANEIMRATGLTVKQAHVRGRKFQKGHINKKELFKVKSKKSVAQTKPNWGNLTNEKRDYNLDKIPSPAKFDS